MNLTAITQEEEVIVKHFCDSLYLLTNYNIPKGASLIDVGTGAGFPGLPLLIARPDIKLTLLDGLNKRLVFLGDVLKETELSAEIVHSRAEEGAADKKFREKFDFATSRAVARLNVLCEYCLPYVKVGGYFVPYKSEKLTQELTEATRALQILGGKVEKQVEFKLPETDIYRNLVVIKKEKATPGKYPRKAGLPAKEPI
jgi:16S rRNA (guanine527-N7)-methyltransferase